MINYGVTNLVGKSLKDFFSKKVAFLKRAELD
jgi:hypothetical protein